LVNAQATLLVRFSATSSCDTAFGVACKIYVLLDGVPQSPVAGYVFDSSPGNNAPNPAKSLAMERVLGLSTRAPTPSRSKDHSRTAATQVRLRHVAMSRTPRLRHRDEPRQM